MLRECHRVLRRDGRLVAAAIEVADGLRPDGLARAFELGPADVAAEAPLRGLVERAGFEVVVAQDVTPDFGAAIAQRLNALTEHEAELRRLEGDEAVDAEREKRSRMLTGVSEGLLRRTIVVGRRPEAHIQTSAGVT